MSPLDEAIVWMAVAGACLLILRLRWAVWLFLPAGVRFLLWPTLWVLSPKLPLWVDLCIIPIIPILVAILVLRGGQAILGGVFGRDVASRVVSRALISYFGALLGDFGKAREQRAPAPILPRPTTTPFRPHHFEEEN